MRGKKLRFILNGTFYDEEAINSRVKEGEKDSWEN
jgi:hypothetical protein